MKILRVFPRRTSFTPRDDLVFIGDPMLFIPPVDEVHVSVAFTWDIQEGQRLYAAWSQYHPIVKIGGPAFGNMPSGFIPGLYVRKGVTFTTRGCDNNCPWCLVPEMEGRLIEIPDFADGHIIQDNNLLQASRPHIEKVFAMLRRQKRAAIFSGGIQSRHVNDWFVEQLHTIRVNSLFLAADTLHALKPLKKALDKLSFLGRNRLRVYCMIGRDESLEQARNRLQAIWDLGGMPFAQLYQSPEEFIRYSHKWKALAREWSRPAAMRATQEPTDKGQSPLW